MKKLIAAAAFLAMTGAAVPAMAQDYNNDGNRFNGPYVGADIGYQNGSFDASNPAGPDGDIGTDGLAGGVFAGYGWANPQSDLAGYLGTELGYEWSDADGSISGTSIEKNGNLLATIKPGAIINHNTLAYGMIGYSRAEFEANGESDDLDGLVLGAGTEFATASPVNVRLEYAHTMYEDEDIGGVGIDGDDNTFKVGALARF